MRWVTPRLIFDGVIRFEAVVTVVAIRVEATSVFDDAANSFGSSSASIPRFGF